MLLDLQVNIYRRAFYTLHVPQSFLQLGDLRGLLHVHLPLEHVVLLQ